MLFLSYKSFRFCRSTIFFLYNIFFCGFQYIVFYIHIVICVITHFSISLFLYCACVCVCHISIRTHTPTPPTNSKHHKTTTTTCTVRKDIELRLQFRFFTNNLHRKEAMIQWEGTYRVLWMQNKATAKNKKLSILTNEFENARFSIVWPNQHYLKIVFSSEYCKYEWRCVD